MKKIAKNLHRYALIVGIAVVGLSFLLPEGSGAIQPVGFVTVFLAPPIGLIGASVSIFNRKYAYLIPNLLVAASFFIAMFIGYVFLSP